MSVLEELGATLRVVAAPMAGGPSTPALVLAAAGAGGLGFLAGGYKTADALADQIAEVRAAGVPFGVNLFVPTPVPVDPVAYAGYAALVGIDPSTASVREDDDAWEAKVAHLVAHPVPVVSFAFGIPSPEVVAALQAAGSRVFQTVTTLTEGVGAQQAGVDGLIVQSAFAGGHSATTTPDVLPVEQPLEELVSAFGSMTDLPLWAAGGIGTPEQVRGALAAGAEAVVVGTVLLRSPESGASATYKAALADRARTTTVVTRAFSGRPARALRNSFTDRFTEVAPAGYPAIHHLTTPLRREAHAAGDPENINLWAGTAFAEATDEPAAVILRRLAGA